MANKTFPVGLSDEKRAEYQEAADKAGVKLAQWIRDACDMRLGKAVEVQPAAGEQVTLTGLRKLADAMGYDVVAKGDGGATSSVMADALNRGHVGGKEFKGPDPKVKPRLVPREGKGRR